MPKEAWNTLLKLYNTNIIARNMQLKQELHSVYRNKMNINEYSMEVKGLENSLNSIGAPVDDKDLVSMILNGLEHWSV